MSTHDTDRDLGSVVAGIQTALEAAGRVLGRRDLPVDDNEVLRRMFVTLAGYHRVARDILGTAKPAAQRQSAHIVEFPAGRVCGPVLHTWPRLPDGAA